MIDLHLHTTASDGRLAPDALVRRVHAAGITVMSVTDHDTVAGLADARRAAERAAIRLVDGIEVTAVHHGRDVHVLGYFFDAEDPRLRAFLEAQRARRVDRLREMGTRLARLGAAVDVEAPIAAAAGRPGTSVGRPALARALMDAGHVSSIHEAFERYLGTGRPAFVPRAAPTPEEVLAMIHEAGGMASMAHPGVTARPDVMAALVEQGLDAIEVHHSDHPPEKRRELQEYAAAHGLLVTGGSDFHGDDDRDRPLGGVSLPADDFARLEAAAGRPRAR